MTEGSGKVVCVRIGTVSIGIDGMNQSAEMIS